MFCKFFFILLLVFISSFAVADEFYTVKLIYFQPTDVKDPPEDIVDMMFDIQETYQQEMIKNGHGDKTFKLERNAQGNVFVHVIEAAKHSGDYINMAWRSMIKEFPDELKGPKNVNVVVIGGIKEYKSTPGMGFPNIGGRNCNSNYGGFVFVAGNTKNLKHALAHNLGQSFALYHNLIDSDNTIMGKTGNGFELHGYETAWLKNHHYFRDDHNFDCAPVITAFHEIDIINRNQVKLHADTKDETELYMAHLLRATDLSVVASVFLEGRVDTMEFEPRVKLVINETRVAVQIMDIQGNYMQRVVALDVPPVTEEDLSVEPKGKAAVTWGSLKKK